ncbi:hypothetical protein COV05_01710 [Candidatus Uhrbacteria bacterium CG10_big_fil_rev_8_21_14_0_10_48_16]|uniref:NAD-dependent epimerase/dehydratase domain-containing protein n=1 Tax=Candidatus Uhrbacteria bacterium CG10_big_fil_rev_8_21_14_0_10_48_16 TaxID=1975038 RepID=A0A2M8LHH4_9BACT|nr:MAG: hypothetical protein COV05_01710 [Candidatus Uhrbacteria bacterium CG10_big_fil_rev_8_21_14_0_10_48_16]
MTSQTILITGGAGFIGSHLAKRLIEEGHEVIIIDNFNPYYDPSLKEARISHLLKDLPYTLYRIDLEDFEAVQKVFETHAIDLIAHQAAQAGVRYSIENPLVYGQSNLIGTLNLLELAKQYHIKGFILASSSSVYGDATSFPIKETDETDKPISLYAATKKSCELLAYSYHHLFELPVTCLRYFTVYGPWGRPDMAIFSFTKSAFEGTPIDVYGQGDMARDFTFIDDLVDGIVKALEKQLPWAVLNLGRGQAQPLMDFITSIETHSGKSLQKNFLDMQPGDVQKTWADITQAKTLLSFEPKTSIDEGVQSFVTWYKNFYDV